MSAKQNVAKEVSAYDKTLFAYVERNQIPISRNLILGLLLLHYTVPWAQKFTAPFISLQYQAGVDENGKPFYDIGFNDAFLPIFCIVFFTFLRSFLMQWVFAPYASHYHQMGPKTQIRFAEQSWCVFYYSGSFLCGLYLYYYSPYWGNLDNVFKGWPHDRMSGMFKLYYLSSIGFWLQQIFVINVEERRKDHYQMFSHHIVTCCLMIGSYYYYYTRIGLLILALMDSSDIFLSLAKVLKYCGLSTACDFMFVFFLFSWIVSRHIIYNYLYYIVLTRAKSLMADGRCVAGVVQKACWNDTVLGVFYGLLGGIQIMTLIWMYSILRVAYRVISGTSAEDVRSDSEKDDEELEETEIEEGSSEDTVTAGEDDESDTNEKDLVNIRVQTPDSTN